MIKENQRLLNQLNVASDGLLVYLLLPVAYWLRFNVLPGGVVNVPLREYMLLDLPITLLFLFSFAAFGCMLFLLLSFYLSVLLFFCLKELTNTHVSFGFTAMGKSI